VPGGEAIADLSIPRVQLSAVVLHGSDAQTLRRGPGHLENTALPGESGNVVIAGHRDTFFWPLRDVQVGDDIFVGTPEGSFHYRVTSLRVVNPHDTTVLKPTDDPVLTLITCYPFWVLGHAPDRFVVRAARVFDTTATTAFAMGTPAPRESIPPPWVQVPAVDDSAMPNSDAVLDDDGLVRQAIERFRLTYNGRLISRADVRPRGPLRFDVCDVTVDEHQAAATCAASSQSPGDRGVDVWTFTLHRTVGGWEIRSIAH
jgi:LPXTG-site transpeptidase (sortase) family protein